MYNYLNLDFVKLADTIDTNVNRNRLIAAASKMYKYLDFNKLASPLDFLSEDPKRMMENVGVTSAYLGGAGAGAMAGGEIASAAVGAIEHGLNRRLDTAAGNYLSSLYGPEFVPTIRNRTKVLDEALRGAGITGGNVTTRLARKFKGEADLSNAARSFHNMHGTPAQRSAARKLFNVADARLARVQGISPRTIVLGGSAGGGILGAAALGEFVRRKVRDRRAAVAEGPQQV